MAFVLQGIYFKATLTTRYLCSALTNYHKCIITSPLSKGLSLMTFSCSSLTHIRTSMLGQSLDSFQTDNLLISTMIHKLHDYRYPSLKHCNHYEIILKLLATLSLQFSSELTHLLIS